MLVNRLFKDLVDSCCSISLKENNSKEVLNKRSDRVDFSSVMEKRLDDVMMEDIGNFVVEGHFVNFQKRYCDRSSRTTH